MTISRRTVLRNGIILGGFAISGCTERSPPATTESTQTDDDEMPTEIELWLEKLSLSMSKRESIDPIVFSELPESQQEIIRTAIDEGEYTTQIGEESDAFSTLRDKTESHANEELEVYLKKSDIYYKVGLVAGDHIIAA